MKNGARILQYTDTMHEDTKDIFVPPLHVYLVPCIFHHQMNEANDLDNEFVRLLRPEGRFTGASDEDALLPIQYSERIDGDPI